MLCGNPSHLNVVAAYARDMKRWGGVCEIDDRDAASAGALYELHEGGSVLPDGRQYAVAPPVGRRMLTVVDSDEPAVVVRESRDATQTGGCRWAYKQ